MGIGGRRSAAAGRQAQKPTQTIAQRDDSTGWQPLPLWLCAGRVVELQPACCTFAGGLPARHWHPCTPSPPARTCDRPPR